MPMSGHNASWPLVLAVMALSIMAASPLRAQDAKPFDHRGLAQRALERHIVPGYDRLATAATEFSDAANAVCDRRTATERRRVDKAFGDLVMAWGRIEHIRFGPITESRRLERILYWPDRRGLGLRQVERALQTHDPSVLDSLQLAGKSVALQGLTAAEQILFGNGKEALLSRSPEVEFRCSYLRAVAANLARIASEVVAAWREADGYRQIWLSPGEGNPAFLKPSETTLALAKAFGEGLERVRDERIAAPLGLGKQRTRLPAVFAKSGRTIALIAANVAGTQELFNEGGLGDAILATSLSQPALDISASVDLIRRELATARQQVSSVSNDKAFPSESFASPLIATGFPLKNARAQADELLSLTAGLTLGFNASDGD